MIFSLLAVILIVASIYDIKYKRVPDWLTLPAIVAGLIITHDWLGAITGAGCIIIVGSVGILVLKKETFGGADVKLMVAVGAFLGWRVALLSFFLAPVFGLLYGFISKEKEISYAPSIALAAGVSYLWVSIGF